MDFKNAKKYILTRLENELKPNLYYHGIHHTMDVYEASIKIAELENLSQEEKIIINTAALFHDSGFIYQYENNEELAVTLTKEILPKFKYNEKQVNAIGNIILTTRITARPQTLLEKIMCDADYDYLGRDDFFKIAETLYKELHEYDHKFSLEEWNEIQVKFLKKHQYYTESSLTLRRPKKLEYYEQLRLLK
ncbi:HD domain-containing protein [Vicingus serpentipes]|jgi:HD superfamily phosphodiesterase|uniref:HD domain-containing protein n=1 Tax=Vicingus serpentipes TaxID=1926625 RepID=A0A5C6RVH2_9FLAO|nr:HD domain-containing protein [Vicingus serpentipes]TXB65342.1 HD domain-containing protein [Vicingus serpentipes]